LHSTSHRLLFTAAWVLAAISAASAQTLLRASAGGLAAPAEVVLHVHSDLKSTDFVEPLVCALKSVLVAPVSAKTLDLPLGPELLATSSQFDVGKVANRFIRATAANGGPRTFKYLLVPYDLKNETYRYVFLTGFGGATSPVHAGVLSTARLDVSDPKVPHHEGGAITTLRAYKLILKSIARVAGYVAPQGCILAFPRNLAELDQKPSEFCPEDRAVLVAAGILKSKETEECKPEAPAVVASATMSDEGSGRRPAYAAR
jgi:predicted Zn-dependent protease